ncbi:MAG: endonuclease/exonuclease/phosphatase family protein, partial [Cytophagales bacterium]|nr:endonuclease/exonuclease/phosphatase family protein [Cytophagales bacterium]
MIRCFLFLCLLGLALASPGQSVHTIGFYNLENLFDTEDDPEKNDEDFTPEGRNQWTGERYRQKLDNMAKVMAGIGHGNDPELIGLCELENRRVIEDLVQHPTLAAKRYQIVHFESPDRRGIDVALVYKPQVFQPFATAQVEISFPGEPDYKTRNALVVSGLMEKDTLTLIVNHWPSRRGGGED